MDLCQTSCSSSSITIARNSSALISSRSRRMQTLKTDRSSRAVRSSRPAAEDWAASNLSSGQWSQRPPSSGASGHSPGSHNSLRRSAQ
jgi:hypothetical protein